MSDSTTSCGKIYIYALIDPRTSEPRYIGKTNDLQKRYLHHLNPRNRDKSYRANWIRALQRLGLQPTLEVLEVTDECNWTERERWWVAYGREQSWRLTNGDDGGTSGKKPTPETLLKLHLSHIGKGHTPQARAKMSASRKGKPLSQRHKESLSQRPHTWGEKISVGKMGHDVSKEARAKMSQRKLEHWDKLGRKKDIVIAYLESNPQDAHLSCRALGRMLGVRHEAVSEAKRELGYHIESRRKPKP